MGHRSVFRTSRPSGAGNIWLDPTAAGAGRFIDETPKKDEEFLAAGPLASKAIAGIILSVLASGWALAFRINALVAAVRDAVFRNVDGIECW